MRRYDWGSPTLMQQLLGEQPDGRPAAELWFGAHPGDPSPALGTTLDRAARPRSRAFGGGCRTCSRSSPPTRRCRSRCIPTAPRPRPASTAEDAAGVPRTARTQLRRRNHKPELLCALTPFEALCGFRPVAGTARDARRARVSPELEFLAESLRGPDGLRAAFTAVLDHPDPGALAAAVAASGDPEGRCGRPGSPRTTFPATSARCSRCCSTPSARTRPGDLPRRRKRARYLRGLGVEIMANSDNVLRCGLTSKHIDVAELLPITDFTELADPIWQADAGRFAVPVPDFALQRLDVAGEVQLAADGSRDPSDGAAARIVLVTHGTVRVGDVQLRPGRAAVVRGDTSVPLAGDGLAFVAQGAHGDGTDFAPK